MENNVLAQAIGNMTVGTLWAYIAGAVVIGLGIFAAGKKVLGILEKYRKKRNQIEDAESDFEKLKKDVVSIEASLNAIMASQRQILADRLNQRIKHYYALGFIPTDEFENFQHQISAYEGVGGNGEMKERYTKCVHDLPVKANVKSFNEVKK